MDGSLPTSLKHIISNAEYYGPSLFLLANEDVMLHALLTKDVPSTREVLSSLPNVFSALCLNAQGLQSFVQCQPFERLFKVLLSPNYLPAIRRRRSSDPLGDTASNLGNAVDELMRHQPTLKTNATAAIIKLLEEICNLGKDPKIICQKPSILKSDGSTSAPPPRSAYAAEEASSEEEEEIQAIQSFNTTQHNETETNRHFKEDYINYLLGLLETIGLDGDTLTPMETDEPCTSDSKGKSKISPAMVARIKKIKPLLSASSRLGRALADLFGLLVKLCVGSPVRQRRSHHSASTTVPTPAARSIASALSKLLTKGLSWQPPPYTPTPRFRTFNWAVSMGGKIPISEGLEHPDLPDGTGEFLDAWLMLVEKMVNPTTVLESPHSLPSKLPGGQNYAQFSALRFLVVTQKAAFICIKNLWNRKPLKVYGGRMAESMLAILCHILQGEPVIQERLSKEKEGPKGEEESKQEESSSRQKPQVNQQQLQQLMDMGFTREHAMEALVNTNTMEQATEYLLTHPPPLIGGGVRDFRMSEEDQMMRAIAMSLGQDIPADQRTESPQETDCRKKEEERKTREKQEEEEAKCLEKFQDAEPLEPEELHNFTDTMLPGCFYLLDELPDTVYRVCDLIMTAIKRNGADYREMILKQVVNQVWEAADVLITAALPLTISDTKTVSEWVNQMATLPEASNLATRILLLTLLFEELKLSCGCVVESSGILNILIRLLEVVQPCLQAAKEEEVVHTPKWITPVLLLIDLYEKTAVSSTRRAQINKYLQGNSNNWRWFDDRSGHWCGYSAGNNSTIDTAWKAGETSVRFTAGRRRYTVHFTTMIQVNEETGNRRPVMLTPLRVPQQNRTSKTTHGQELGNSLEEGREVHIQPKEEKEGTYFDKEMTVENTKSGDILIQGLTEEMVTILIRGCVSMLDVPVDPDTLHATLRLCLRLTRNHKYAMMFAELKSTRIILNLTQNSGFNGFIPLVTLLLPCTLHHTMEKVVRSAASNGAGSTTSGVLSGSLGSREINYILRVLGPAACRNPDIFTEVASGCVRIALPAPRGSGTKSEPKPQEISRFLQDMGDDVYQQYRSLTQQGTDFGTQSGFTIDDQVFAADGTSTETHQSGTSQGQVLSPEESREEKKKKERNQTTEESKQKAKGSKPLMPTSIILRLLAELVRSYVGIATLIANYNYTVGQSELIKEDCSVLAFVLDHLLPHTQSTEDKDTPALARLFLASLAAAGSGSDAQVALVNEVKAALGRALAMTESAEKHSSPSMANTVNAALKPLETLSRIVNQPSNVFGSKSASSKSKSEQDAQGTSQGSNGNTRDPLTGETEVHEEDHDVTQTEVADGDIMNRQTENDTVVIAGQQEVFSTQEMQVENELDDLIDELLERDDGSGNSTIMVGRSGEDESQEDVLMDEAPSNLSQGSTLQSNQEDSMNTLDPEDEGEHTQESEMELDEDYPDLNASPLLQFERFDREDDFIIEFDNMFSSTTDIPPSARNIPAVHPLMVRHGDYNALTFGSGFSTARLAQGFGRSQRTLRQLTTNTGHTIHVHYPGNRQPNPPFSLQRLLGPSATADILQMSGSLPLQSRGRARLLMGNDDVHVIARSDDELLDDFFHDQTTATSQAGKFIIPTALTRWREECKVLDAESMHDCVSVVKVPIVNHLESLRDEELEERREKRRKQLAEEEAKIAGMPKEEKENKDQNTQGTTPKTNDTTEHNLEVLNSRRPTGETEAIEMELSPFPTIISSPERAEDSDILTAVSSQLAGSPMDTSSLASCNLEEEVGTSESSSTQDSATAISGTDSRKNLEEPLPSTRSEEDPLAGINLPEGVDPSFLAALPDDIRREVLQNQLGIRPPARDTPATTNPILPVVGNPNVTEVSPEFLAALPPAIQEEVLAQQRVEQQRRELAQHTSSDSSMDPVTFIQTLPSDLRRSVLEDMEDSVLAVMPPDIAAEAQALRREQEARQRQLMHERLFGHSSTSALSAILRSPAFTNRLSSNREVQYTRVAVQRGGTSSYSRPSGSNMESLLRLRGRLLLDHEALSCLLVLLFVDEPKLNTSRLHRVLRNLCYHAQTRHWVIRSLLSILQRSSESELCIEIPKSFPAEDKGQKSSKFDNRSLDLLHKMESKSSSQLSWLSVSVDAALGCRTNIFQIQRSGGRKHVEKHVGCGSAVHIHPQAAPLVCRHVLDTLIQLAKVFPNHFTQQWTKDTNYESDRERSNKQASSPCPGESTGSSISTDFWDLLVKLDNVNVSRKGKNSIRSIPVPTGGEGETFPYSLEASPLGQLMNMLSHPVIRRSSLLTEKLLRLLSLISIALPKTMVPGLTENQLQLSVEVLTSHSCSEEGLEDAASVLLQLSRGDPLTRDTVVKLLLNGARHLGHTLCLQIGTLLAELREYNLEQLRRTHCETISPDSLPEEQPQTTKLKGKMQSRFDSAENVVIVASQKRLFSGRELQLPSMCMLTCKTSTQKFFLRVLQVIIQLRDDARRANKKAKQISRLGSSSLGSAGSIQAAVQQLEAEAIIQMVREGQRTRRQQPAATEVSAQRDESPMDVDQPSPITQDLQPIEAPQQGEKEREKKLPELPLLSEQLSLDELWDILSECLKELEESHDQHAVLVHATERESKPPVRDSRESQLAHIKDEPPPLSPASLTPATPSSLDPFFSREPSSMHISSSLPPDTQKFLRFAETHRTVLNQILRQSTTHLSDGPFAVLVDYIRVLDFDVKRKYGGLLREWYMIISREMFNPMYALFRTSPGDRVTYTINPSSHCNPNHLSYFKFVGRIVAKAVYDNRLLDCYFTRSFYKHILGKSVRYTDMESEDYHFYQGLVYLLENDVSSLGYDLTFSTEVQEFGVCEVRDLKPNGANILVNEENKKEYVHLVCQMRMTGAIQKQLAAFLEGFYEIIPKHLISIFTEQELELLISGLPTIDIDDLKSNTEYHKYQSNSIQIQWFWRALRSFDQADRAKFLQFVTGTSKVPLQGFAALEGMNGIQKFQIHRDDRSTDRLPSAHTCFNQLDLPAYENYEKLCHMLLLAIQECSEGFGLA
uniref:E3 ubiquitin-protein ligase HUWE1 n=1 Tax=Notamacropus eugenii TaxID=9315 RepID=W8BYZ8_NOTEU